MDYFYHNCGFLVAPLHHVPAEAVPVSEKEHGELMAAQASGASIQPDESGRPMAVYPPVPNANAVRIAEINARFSQIDEAAARPTRVIAAGLGTEADTTILYFLEVEAEALRDELRRLGDSADAS